LNRAVYTCLSTNLFAIMVDTTALSITAITVIEDCSCVSKPRIVPTVSPVLNKSVKKLVYFSYLMPRLIPCLP